MEENKMLVRRNTAGYLPSIFDAFFNEANNLENSTIFTKPEFNVFETEKDFVIEGAVPGMEKKDFKIEINDNLLEISSEKEAKEERKEQKFFYKGFCYGSFKKSYSLPENINKEKINAGYENGILTITIPKDEQAKVLKQIKVG
ncbi:MAG: Hsp20/alpha crystallin family protein [Bacteroidales bacterium]|nr:Hsp20/alpha crystallin family protein [Bacteroidales bacterium]MCK9498725.1 Hsp20/alpha crystallin family protein [Bacteroidales bacterium]MDY0313802.1 Hsp20/alpha crystallin family protein [Bacteroidales bacterium]